MNAEIVPEASPFVGKSSGLRQNRLVVSELVDWQVALAPADVPGVAELARHQAIPANIALNDARRVLTWEVRILEAHGDGSFRPEPGFGVLKAVDMQLGHLHVSVLVRVPCVWLDRFPLVVMIRGGNKGGNNFYLRTT